jgi:enoyl-CoA hydratase/carnithine racemase
MANYEYVLTEIRDRVGIVTLNRPESLNALHPQQGREMREAILELDAHPDVGAIVLTGAGRAFCAGADVKGWNRRVGEREAASARPTPAEAPRPQAAAGGRRETMLELWQRVKPAVIAFNGDAIGAGLTITLGADYRIASDRARLSMRFARMGVMPEIQSTMLLAHLVGLQEALDMMITGEIFDAQHCLRIGLVGKVVPHERLIDEAVAHAARYARVHPDTTREVKRLVWANLLEQDLDAVRRREQEAFRAASQRPSHKEAVRAFVEKRQPDFYRAVREAGGQR